MEYVSSRSEEQRLQAIEEGPWTFAQRPLVLKEWKPGMKMDRKSIEKLPIWIRLSGLAFEHLNIKLLSKIASTVGKTLFPNSATIDMDRVDFVVDGIDTEVLFPENICAPGQVSNAYALLDGDPASKVHEKSEMRKKMLVGDFNYVLKREEALGGGPPDMLAVLEKLCRRRFKDCVDDLRLGDIQDHSPMKIMVDEVVKRCGSSFKFQSFWCSHPDYKSVVEECWKEEVVGTDMFALNAGMNKLFRAKSRWLALGDSCTRYFDIKMRCNQRKSGIGVVTNAEGNVVIVFEEVAATAIYKAPGPDGFTIKFYKKSWEVVGGDFIKAIREIFAT
ncbi:hypothetical protein LIER_28532 [Lithospermum erythrorhizon]|uniref:DUF4283 domain-containing protein n=1 Tax=Lithospermum erythrorhizon TaxID=34254 RepID=A0AAV3RG24_LITER